jgi:hypothetical protein
MTGVDAIVSGEETVMNSGVSTLFISGVLLFMLWWESKRKHTPIMAFCLNITLAISGIIFAWALCFTIYQ